MYRCCAEVPSAETLREAGRINLNKAGSGNSQFRGPLRDLAGILLYLEGIYASQTHYAHRASRITECMGRLAGKDSWGISFINSLNNLCFRICWNIDLCHRKRNQQVGIQVVFQGNTIFPQKKKIKNRTTYNPAIPPLGIYPKKTKILISKDICTPMFVAVLFTTAKIWKPPKHPSID